MNWLFTCNGLIVGGCIGWAVGSYLGFGLAMTFLVGLLCGAAGLAAAWWLQKHWG